MHAAVFYVLGLLSLAAGLASAQDFSTVPPCGQTCFNNVKSTATVNGPIGCSGTDQVCLCGKQDYRNGLRDCMVQSCPGDTVALNALNTYVDAVCAAAATSAPPVPSASSTSPPPPPPPPATTTSSQPASTTSSSSTTSASPVSATSSASVSAGVGSLTETPSSSPTSSGASSTSSSAISASATSTPTLSSAPASNAGDTETGGLSYATKLGIGIGAAAAAVGLVGVALCVLLHKRRNKRNGGIRSLNISDPMPGSGRSYAGDHHNEKYEVGMDQLEFQSRRYEDMLPRQSPRTMV